MPDLDALNPLIARPASLVYRAVSALHRAGYDRGWRRAERLPVPIVSVGNLEVGGTGKTPAVAALAQAALRAGLRPAILTRGYAGSGRAGVLRNGAWTSGGPNAATSPDADAGGDAATSSRADAADAGDEPLLLSRALPSVPVVVGKRRAENARALLATGEPIDLFLLDDGFQHRALARDRDLVLLDARRPFANGRLLPAGPLREPPGALRRAHHILLTGAAPDEPLDAGVARLLDQAVSGRAAHARVDRSPRALLARRPTRTRPDAARARRACGGGHRPAGAVSGVPGTGGSARGGMVGVPGSPSVHGH